MLRPLLASTDDQPLLSDRRAELPLRIRGIPLRRLLKSIHRHKLTPFINAFIIEANGSYTASYYNRGQMTTTNDV